jgi:hypothetical protein
MNMHTRSDPKAFSRLEQRLGPFEAHGRTDSAAFLLWFLQIVYRLDDVEAQDAVCDSRLDGGIDALTVSDDLREIVIFQAKRRQKLPATLGDTDIKEFVGSMAQFTDAQNVRTMAQTTENGDLRRLLTSNKVAEKLEMGYHVRGIFIANISANKHCYTYISVVAQKGTVVDLWDLQRLSPILDQLERDWYINRPISLYLAKGKVFSDGPKDNPRLVYTAVPVKQLVKLPGIADTRLFAQNVRLGLGNTRVNKEIIESVRNKNEHGKFLTFHNGLTIVAKHLKLRGNTIKMNEYSVCNGCQSLLIFYENRDALTDEMEVLVRIVRVTDERSLTELIAYRTNNQNSISLRDLSSNDDIQIQLKAEFDHLFGPDVTYTIKRGDQVPVREFSNEYAGQLLLALYACQPWNSHQKYRIFGDLQSQIYRYGITAYHIRLAHILSEIVGGAIQAITFERVRKYSLTKFVLLYLVGEMLRKSPDGKNLLENPVIYLSTQTCKNDKQDDVIKQVGDLAHLAVAELNYFIEEHGGEAYDYKSEFKSPRPVEAFRNEALKGYEKDVYRGRAILFSTPKQS